MVILLVAPLRVRWAQLTPRVRSPLNTGQFGAEEGISTSVLLSGTSQLSQFDVVYQVVEADPVQSPASPARR